MVVLTVLNTFNDLDNSIIDKAILPIGSIEQHGPHLPLGTDLIIVQHIAEKVAGQLGNCYLLPALPYSNSQEHLCFRGTISLKPSTLAQIIKDIVLSLYLHDIKKIIVISGHGGNWIIKPTIRELNLEYPDLKIIHSNTTGKKPFDVHAGESETSAMLYIDEPTVKKEQIVDSLPDVTQEYIDYVGMKALSQHGNWGKASQASKKKGEHLMKTEADNIASYIKKTLSKLEELEHASPRRSIIPSPPNSPKKPKTL